MPDSDNAEWRAEYGKRVGEVMDFLVEDGRTVIWVGIPNDDDPDVTARMQVQDETAKAEAAKRPGDRVHRHLEPVLWSHGGWAEYVIDPRDGRARTSAPTTASTSTRPAPRSSPSTSPKRSKPTSAPAARTI